MKRILKFFVRIVAMAAAILLVITFYPYVQEWVSTLLPSGKYVQTSTLLTHEMQKVGKLTAVRHTDTGVMVASMQAALIGDVNKVSVEYQYEIGLGIDLGQVQLTAGEDGITVSVPPVEMIYDQFVPTKSPAVTDIFHLLTEAKYQEMLNSQSAACQKEYLDDAACMQEAWDAACEALLGLMRQWGGDVPFTFIPLTV